MLVGALATSRFQRIREAALLRTLGATRSQLFASCWPSTSRSASWHRGGAGARHCSPPGRLRASSSRAASRCPSLRMSASGRGHRGTHRGSGPGQQPRRRSAHAARSLARSRSYRNTATFPRPPDLPHARDRPDRQARPRRRRLRRRRLRIRHRQGAGRGRGHHLRGQLAAGAGHLHQAARAGEDGRVDAACRRRQARVRADLSARRRLRHAWPMRRRRSGRTSATRSRATSASRE